MAAGDLVLIYAQTRVTTTHSIATTGGQTWVELSASYQNGGGIGRSAAWYAIFDGTWTTNPQVTSAGGATYCFSAEMLVFRPSSGSTFSVDTAFDATVGTSSTTMTRAGATPTAASSVAIASFHTNDVNTYSSLSGSGWATTTPTQIRNTKGVFKQSSGFAYKIQTSAAATGDVSVTQATNGPDAYAATLIIFGESGGSGRTADAAITEAADTVASAATLEIQAGASVTESADTVVSAATLDIQAAASITEAGDTLSAASTLEIQAALSGTEGGDTLVSEATLASLIGADAAITEADDALVSASMLDLQAAAAITDDGDTLASAAFLGLQAVLAVAEDDDALASAATLGIQAALAVTEDDDTLASDALLDAGITAAASVTEGDDTLAAAATLALQAALSITEDDDTLAADGAQERLADLAVTEDDDTLSSDGYLGMEPPAAAPAPSGGSSGRRRVRNRFRVVIDEEELFFDTLAEAEQALEAAEEIAAGLAHKIAMKARPVIRVRNGRVIVRAPKVAVPRIVIDAPTESDARALEHFREDIRQIYRKAVRVQHAAHQAEMDEEEDIVGLLL